MNGQSFIDMQIAVAALYITYLLFINGKVAHKYARCYLLSIVPLSAIIAFTKIPFWSSPSTVTSLYDAQTTLLSDILAPQAITSTTNYVQYIYWSGMAIMGLWFLIAIVKVLILLLTTKPKNGIRYIDKGCAFSFFNALFISTQYKECDNIDAIIVHEQCHASHLHSIDVIYCNLCRAVLWFNPFAWLIFHSLRQVHEWQADASVIKFGVDKVQYIDLLLDAGSATNVEVVNSINYSLTKKRIIMIAKQQKKSTMRLFIALPVIFSLVISMTFTTKATEISTATQASQAPSNEVDQIPQFTIDKKGVEDFRLWAMTTLKFDTPMEHIQGRVVINFTIETDGTVSNVKIVRGVDEKVDKAIADVIAKSPKWYKPAYKGGVAVKFTLNLPIDIKAK